jgi:uncharacterized C2H2 Zn-finger protein
VARKTDRMRAMTPVFMALRWEAVRGELRVSTTRAGRLRCGLCGRVFSSEKGLTRHAANVHPNEYRRAVRRALVGLTLRFGGVPKSFVAAHAPWLLRARDGEVAREKKDGRDCLLLFYN